MHRIQTGGRRFRIGFAALVAMWAVLFFAGRASLEVEALQFPDLSLDELALDADVVFVGTLTSRTEERDAEFRYTFRVDIPLKGGLEKKTEWTVRVPQSGDGGNLDKGATYLVLLRKTENGGEAVAGIRQSFIKLKNGRAESCCFSQEEVDRYLARYGLKVMTIYERLVPLDAPDSRRHSVREAKQPAVLWAGGLALAALMVWLFARAIRNRRRRV